MDFEIPKKYDHKLIERKIYEKWIKGNYFSSYPDNRTPYTIIMPPPNVTGKLHIGHALNNTIQDVLARHARMNGYNVCWVPGLDHASIATEAKVVEKLIKKGKSKNSLGRKKFLSYVLKWVKYHKEIILNQIKILGCSCDWNRLKFTMDKKLYKSVIKVFIDLYKKGYIYRGYRIVNWDPKSRTTISDEEIVYKNKTRCLYYIKYKIENDNKYVVVATTRPETIFGDTAICFNPNDNRFYHLNDKRVIVPIINKSIPIIKDSCADINFGTGCFKVTPAHDIRDKYLSEKHKLDVINIFNKNATINEKGLHYKNMDRFFVRKKIVEELKSLGFLLKVEKLKQKIGFSERTLSEIEYIPSIQWFLKMNKISKKSFEAVKNKEILFYPEKYKKIYFKWMKKIRDWNISRQLWWGHRIPAFFYGNGINDFVIAENIDDAMKEIKNKVKNSNITIDDIKQDPDVLDTWFSSWLLPISVFDGIINPYNNEIKYYYPLEDMVTGSDILFFWISRMIMSGFLLRNKKPFNKVFFTGIVRDSNNKKISKSLNNSPDYTYLIDKYGADSVRFGVILKTTPGKDFFFEEKMCLQGRNFINKVWNAFRLINSLKKTDFLKKNEEYIPPHCVINWIKNRFYYILNIFNKQISKYKLNESLMILYKFFLNDFCSIFLEVIKPYKEKYISKKVYNFIIKYFKKILKLLHPYIPFISEKIWNIINSVKNYNVLMISSWPKNKNYDIKIISSFKRIIKIISLTRKIKNENSISKDANCVLFSMKKENKEYFYILKKLANISKVIYLSKEPKNYSYFHFFLLDSEKFFLFFSKKNYTKLNKKNINNIKNNIKNLNKFLYKIRDNLLNKNFLSCVPKKILLKERKKEIDTIKKINSLEEYLKSIKKSESYQDSSDPPPPK
ncbi:valine--tRNA ligase [Blattabacterium cuenoti]|uniref:valine--tRNA ligase n=1 Tax=Blattabacterium cuenoti TaxID=1653831 RepID=UPI00163D3531|nr:valine--tRNA ligase [Blattabacterium cuenoti]